MQPKLWYPLAEAYKPSQLLFREIQLNQLTNYVLHELPVHVWSQGDPGLGKTLTARILQDELVARNAAKVFYFECKSSLRKTFEEANLELALNIPKYDLNPSTLARKIMSMTPEDKHVVIIFDEPINMRFKRDLGRAVHEMYNVLLGNATFNFIFVSQLLYPLTKTIFEAATLSRLQLKHVAFAPYNAEEIIAILNQRLEIMLDKNQYSLGALSLLAQHIRRIGGDMRQALSVLRDAVELSNDTLTTEHMQTAISLGKQKWWKSELEALPPHWSFLLYLTAQQVSNEKDEFTLQTGIAQKYYQLSNEMQFDPLGRRTLYHAFTKLAEKGYVHPQTTGSGRNRIIKLFIEKGDNKRIIEAGEKIEWDVRLCSAE